MEEWRQFLPFGRGVGTATGPLAPPDASTPGRCICVVQQSAVSDVMNLLEGTEGKIERGSIDRQSTIMGGWNGTRKIISTVSDIEQHFEIYIKNLSDSTFGDSTRINIWFVRSTRQKNSIKSFNSSTIVEGSYKLISTDNNPRLTIIQDLQAALQTTVCLLIQLSLVLRQKVTLRRWL